MGLSVTWRLPGLATHRAAETAVGKRSACGASAPADRVTEDEGRVDCLRCRRLRKRATLRRKP